MAPQVSQVSQDAPQLPQPQVSQDAPQEQPVPHVSQEAPQVPQADEESQASPQSESPQDTPHPEATDGGLVAVELALKPQGWSGHPFETTWSRPPSTSTKMSLARQ